MARPEAGRTLSAASTVGQDGSRSRLKEEGTRRKVEVSPAANALSRSRRKVEAALAATALVRRRRKVERPFLYISTGHKVYHVESELII
jgi:hypothetical protein